MIVIPKIRIFWGESYHHAGGRLCSANELLSSFLAYMLLADEIIIHPVAMWQCDLARWYFRKAKISSFNEPKAKLLMSRDESVYKYMSDRIPHLNSIRKKNPEAATELQYYIPYKDALLEESALLDDLFPKKRGILVASWNKPLTHRKLIIQELRDPNIPDGKLGNLILSSRGSVSRADAFKCIKRIALAAQDLSNFFSTDVVLFELTKSGFSEKSILNIRKRLSVVLLKVNTGDDIHTPIISKFERAILDPLSSDVFWYSMECLIGKRIVRSILELDKNHAYQVCSEISQNPEWKKFVNIYKELVLTVCDEINGVNEDILKTRLSEIHPGFFKHWWSVTGKTSLAALICGMVSAESVISSGILGTTSLVFSMGAFVGSVFQATYGYIHSDRHRLFYNVRKALGSNDPYKSLKSFIT